MDKQQLAEQLKDLSKKKFDGWNEATVREEFIAPLLRLLGYARDSDYDINRESEHLLSKPFIMIGSRKQKLDYAIVVRKKTFWILEAKRPDPPTISDEAVFQAHFYTLHPEVNARYFGVCNGRELVLFDTRKLDEKYEPILRIAAADLPKRFDELNRLIGSSAYLCHLTDRVLDDIKTVLSVEVREDRLDSFARKVDMILDEVRPVVKNNAAAIWSRKFAESHETLVELTSSATIGQFARVLLEFPDTRHKFDIMYRVFAERLAALPRVLQHREVEAITRLASEPLSTLHRCNILKCMIRLHGTIDGFDLTRDIAAAIKAPIFGFPEQQRLRAVWLLENTVHRFVYKASFTDRSLHELFANEAARQASLASDEEYIWNNPSVWGQRQAWVRGGIKILWTKFMWAPPDVIVSICQEMERMEADIDATHGSEIERQTSAEGDLTFLAAYGKPWDRMRSGIFHVLVTEFDKVYPFVDDEIVEQTERLLKQVGTEYTVNYADELWTLIMNERRRVVVAETCPADLRSKLVPDTLSAFIRGASINRQGRSAVKDGMRIWGKVAEGEYIECYGSLDLTERNIVIDTIKMMK